MQNHRLAWTLRLNGRLAWVEARTDKWRYEVEFGYFKDWKTEPSEPPSSSH
jgi:hypothetical protein